MSEKFYAGLDLVSSINNGKYKPISRVTLWKDGSMYFTAGDDSGYTIEADCPHATQEMADEILANFKGYQYQAYEADAVNIDPAAELGDGFTGGGLYSVISTIDDDGSGYPSFSAPGEAELEDEYPAPGPMSQELERIALQYSKISKDTSEIRSEVYSLEESITKEFENYATKKSLEEYSTIKQTSDSIALSVKQSQSYTDTKTGDILSKLEKYSTIEQTNESITLEVGKLEETFNGRLSNYSTIKQTANSIDMAVRGLINGEDAQSLIDIALGEITMEVSSSEGSTTFKLKAGSAELTAQTLDLTVDAVNVTGTITAKKLKGETIDIVSGTNNNLGSISVTDASSTNKGSIQFESIGALRLQTAGDNAGDIFIQAYYDEDSSTDLGAYVHITYDEVILGYGDTRPSSKNYWSCGTSDCPWGDIYAANAEIQTSDREEKTDIAYDLANYENLFDLLQPVSFRFKEGSSGRRHMGMIAQDVEDTLTELGISTLDFAGFIKSPKKNDDGTVIDGEYNYALRYGEFIPMCIDQIQRLKKRVAELEAKS